MAASLLLLAAALVSLFPTDVWFVRIFDLVREPVMYVCAILLLVALVFSRGAARAVSVAAFAGVIGINLLRMWPYNALAGEESFALQDDSGNLCFTALSMNVKVKNDDYGAIAAQVRRVDPDVLLLMETDERWVREMQPVLAPYPVVRARPQPHAFGMVFASRVPVSKARFVENTFRDTPTLYATLDLSANSAAARQVEFIGLHPKPPLPGWNTEMRDRNIVDAGVQTPDRLPDAFVMGDFNDVPWSRTTSEFRDTGDWRDPRIGRGAFPTFPSKALWLGWPLDQLMVKGDVRVADFRVMDDDGSDHRAMFAHLCVAAESAASSTAS